ncbi:uncharacterized protein LOC141634213 [Silene latifolia]|uniref:uncharacterized protein LOC141634213 n=1 Tax=Silene latifolia TaxID=37657 RepID=UPI003D770922
MSGKNDNDVLWLLDSGATHHMTGSRHLLKDVCKIKPCPVTLPNGKSSQAVEEGKVELGGKIVLNNVLFVPEFECNLISVYQLSTDLDCTVQFTKSSCVIQDRASKTKIGTFDQRGRLYLLRGSTTCACGSQKRDDEVGMWHRRLGHPSKKIVQISVSCSDSLLFRNVGENDVVYDNVVYDEEILLGDVLLRRSTDEPDVGRPSGDESLTQGGVPGPDGGDVNETTQEPESGSGDAGSSHGGADEVEGELGRGKRPHVPWSRYDESEYVTGAARVVEPVEGHDRPSCSNVSSSSGMPYPLAHYVKYDQFSVLHRCFLTNLDDNVEPKSFREAVRSEKWRQAVQAEVDALVRNGTWEIVDSPSGKKVIGNKWVYKVKLRADGSVERYKARLVILGNKQEAGIDYYETFAPTAKMGTVRVFLALAAAGRWELHQMDAPRCWFAKLSAALVAFGFVQCLSDYSLFCYAKGDDVVYILVYVDDLVIGGNDNSLIVRVKEYLNTCFHMKDLGALKYFLGIEVARNSTGIFVCQ